MPYLSDYSDDIREAFGDMEFACYLGAHCTEGRRIQATLQKNASFLEANAVFVPDPAKFRKVLNGLDELTSNSADQFFWALQSKVSASSSSVARVVLNNDRQLGMPKYALRKGVFYPNAEKRLQNLVELLPNSAIQVFFIIRNPATFIPALLKQSKCNNLAELTSGADPLDYRWSELFERLTVAFPQLSFTVCCFEDLPYLWGELIGEILSVQSHSEIQGQFDMAFGLMNAEGIERFQQYLEKRPELNELQTRRLIAAFLEHYAIESELYETISIPNWDERLIEDLSDSYDDDVIRTSKIARVSFIWS